MKYIPTVGLEIHVQLNTKSKMFCGCSQEAGAEPNTQVCPGCLGYPGTLPLLNREAVRKAAMAGMMLGCRIAPVSAFERKNYFYPDASKNYQITQAQRPICLGGSVAIEVGGVAKTVRLHHIHLEEDVAKSLHYAKSSGVDFNRCGVALMEIVTEPDMESVEEVVAFHHALRQIMIYADAGNCNLEEGNMRCDVNVSVRPEGTATLGTRIEIKNMNAPSVIQDALAYEVSRQIAVLEAGGALRQETRGWNAELGETFAMRSKENAHDYRYFPEPDIPPIVLDDAQLDAWRAMLPELPSKKRERFVAEYAIPDYDAGVLSAQRPIADYFEATAKGCNNPKAASNWIMTDLLRYLGETGKEIEALPLTPSVLAELILLVDKKVVNMPTAKTLFAELIEKGGSPEAMVKERGLGQVSDTAAIEKFAAEVVAANPKVVDDFKNGKQAALQFLVGQVMKLSRGKANPQLAAAAIQKEIMR
ncbi:MAG: Asp-tRNA(Asn)/Glu-tRNA(Gln) amidotransferase subunit GatB [Kiritimatiellaeota bacterium]|nr:Asp-tRNA(Asn)/Glu-tRNA(Gln) amidotransferase subunit GatB [Kiritimatiellota bacterium]